MIGLEVHAQLKTKSKIFCGCEVHHDAPPNKLTCPVCLGLPGALPVLNKAAVELAIRMILAAGGTVNRRSSFARKNYFYPDLPKGYQITQYDKPIGTGGRICYNMEDGARRICRLVRIHLEEDAGKSLHPARGDSFTRLDFNRCGVPLLEIVADTDIATPEEANSYLMQLKRILQYVDACTGDMEKGHLRCDANVSLRPVGRQGLGTRTEIKNMNSFKGVEKALRFEINRQKHVLDEGGKIQQETLLWNEKTQAAESMRSKEESEDYRYFPEPDLVNLHVSEEWIKKVKLRLPELPDQRASRLVRRYGIRESDAAVLTDSRPLADYFEEVMVHFHDGQTAANWIQTELLGALRASQIDISEYKVTPKMVADLLGRVKSGEISGKIAKVVFDQMNRTLKLPELIIEEKGLDQISDRSVLRPVVDKVLADHEDKVARYREGKTGLFDFLVGRVMAATGGRANPRMVSELLKERLEG
jgi:aspartyl-tRNA(Asn)/glutamyl-tRNA(Gln) amidotransferase subunit B